MHAVGFWVKWLSSLIQEKTEMAQQFFENCSNIKVHENQSSSSQVHSQIQITVGLSKLKRY
jgi:hypothetical protein